MHVANLCFVEQDLSTGVYHFQDVAFTSTQEEDEVALKVLLHYILIWLEGF